MESLFDGLGYEVCGEQRTWLTMSLPQPISHCGGPSHSTIIVLSIPWLLSVDTSSTASLSCDNLKLSPDIANYALGAK